MTQTNRKTASPDDPLTTIRDVINVLGGQRAVGRLFSPPISQQAVGLWAQECSCVPADRVPTLVMALAERGYEIDLAVLNPTFAAIDALVRKNRTEAPSAF